MKFIIILALLLIYANAAEEQIGGQIAFDSAWIEGADSAYNGKEIRRARLFIKGAVTTFLYICSSGKFFVW